METATRATRLPRSVRKYLRTRKAQLRRALPPDKAAKEIERLERSLRH